MNEVRDFHYIKFPAVQFVKRTGSSLNKVAPSLGLNTRTAYGWVSGGYLPLKVFKAICMTYKLSPNDFEGKVYQHTMPYKMNAEIEHLVKAFDEKYKISPYHSKYIGTAPVRLPKVHDVVDVPVVQAETEVNSFSSLASMMKNKAATTSDEHAGIRALSELCKTLKVERNTAQEEVARLTKENADLNGELQAAKAMIEELLADSVPNPEKIRQKQIQETRDLVESIDPDLLAELNKTSPKLQGQTQS